MSVGIRAPSMTHPLRLPERTRRSAVGSPGPSVRFKSVTSAPMLRQTRRMPSRVGLTPTLFMRISEPGTISAAAMKKAADEISPGTVTACARRGRPG